MDMAMAYNEGGPLRLALKAIRGNASVISAVCAKGPVSPQPQAKHTHNGHRIEVVMDFGSGHSVARGARWRIGPARRSERAASH
jgi:hypothetical protein